MTVRGVATALPAYCERTCDRKAGQIIVTPVPSDALTHFKWTGTLTSGREIAGLPCRVPMIDVQTVGAGGGSIAWIDAGIS